MTYRHSVSNSEGSTPSASASFLTVLGCAPCLPSSMRQIVLYETPLLSSSSRKERTRSLLSCLSRSTSPLRTVLAGFLAHGSSESLPHRKVFLPELRCGFAGGSRGVVA